MSGPARMLPADLTAGLRRLKLGAMRQLAPEVLLTAKTQRWAPEEVLRTLIEAEIASRDASNTRARLKAAAFPVSSSRTVVRRPIDGLSRCPTRRRTWCRPNTVVGLYGLGLVTAPLPAPQLLDGTYKEVASWLPGNAQAVGPDPPVVRGG